MTDLEQALSMIRRAPDPATGYANLPKAYKILVDQAARRENMAPVDFVLALREEPAPSPSDDA